MIRTALLRTRSFLRRSSPMRRSSKLHARGNTKHARRERAHAFMEWTSRQPCMVLRYFERLHFAATGVLPTSTLRRDSACACEGRIEVDHAGDRFDQGDGTRAYDWTCVPLCARHHRQRTSWAGTLGQSGVFFGFTRETHRRWCTAAIALHHELATRARIEVPTC